MQTALEWWPTAGMPGDLNSELPTPKHFEAVAQLVTQEEVAKQVACGPDPRKHLDMIQQYIDAGYDHIYIHQVGPDQMGFFGFAQKQILPEFAAVAR
jgi:hypothetical protein